VDAEVGQQVKNGQPLFRLDVRQLEADQRVRQAALNAAKAELHRMEQAQKEEVPVAECRVAEAKANLADWQDQLNRARELYNRHVIGEEELVRREQAAAMARHQLARANAELTLLQSNAWQARRAVQQAAVEQSAAQVKQIETEIERSEVRAIVPEGKTLEVLQVNVRRGEYVGAPPGQALIVLGGTKTLHVRVDIDENDIPRFREAAPAVAELRGAADTPRVPLRFVRVEPLVIPKQALTGDNKERVDTRVLQVLYAFDPTGLPVRVGQQVDVFIDVGAKGAPAKHPAPAR
jgi:multidrug resistance efflux pump